MASAGVLSPKLTRLASTPATVSMLNTFSPRSNASMETRTTVSAQDSSSAERRSAPTGSEGERNPERSTDRKSSGSEPESAEREKKTSAQGPILLVEDNPGDVLLVREALREHGLTEELIVITDGEKAVEFIENLGNDGGGPCPVLVMLDLNLPKRTGHDVLKCMRNTARCQGMPVVILSSSDAPADRRAAAAFNISRYIRKPSTLDEFMMIGGIVSQLLAFKADA